MYIYIYIYTYIYSICDPLIGISVLLNFVKKIDICTEFQNNYFKYVYINIIYVYVYCIYIYLAKIMICTFYTA